MTILMAAAAQNRFQPKLLSVLSLSKAAAAAATSSVIKLKRHLTKHGNGAGCLSGSCHLSVGNAILLTVE